jgi:hypothetical protein
MKRRRSAGAVKPSGNTKRILRRFLKMSSNVAAIAEADTDPDSVAAGIRGGKALS